MMYYIEFLILTFSLVAAKNNVCPSHLDYFTITFNSKCWYDPDVDATIPEIINNYGFKSESYNVTTLDGYIIEIFRIPSKLNEISNKTKTPLILFHGMARDARSWLILGEDSPAIYYAKKGYDVWLANRRGTEYSSHIKYSRNDKEFWNFSFHEMGTIDVPTVVEKVAEVSKQPGNIIFVGHSMGTTSNFVYCSTNSTHCGKNLKGIISLAPVAKLSRNRIPFSHFLAIFTEEIKSYLNSLGIYRLEIDSMFRKCLKVPLTFICSVAIKFFTGSYIFPTKMPLLFTQGNTPVSVKVLAHYGQIINSNGHFRHYDYGKKENLKKYNTLQPPKYNLENIPVHVTLLYTLNDLVAHKHDVDDLYSNLNPNKRDIVEIPRKNLGHLDFITPSNVEQDLYSEINNALKKIKNI
ncbi:unnamed protein product [Brassicogethes aeneus]|uniref:Lipase n=1 Tax=Brassicogethes aeneus TaxID=1431903 RepID=A0A9P0B672_BRAAE|nr:unnamed protein product [Brassicogethes aeneus]